MNPETLKRVRTEAESYANGKTTDLELFHEAIGALPRKERALIFAAIQRAYLAGADAGYTAAKAEER